MRIPSGTTDQVIFFVAVDATDLKTRETGLSSFTVYRARDTGAATAMTTPTVAELSAANMPGVYSLLLDEDMTIGAGNDSEEMVFHITQASMAPVTRSIELYRPKITLGETVTAANGAADADIERLQGSVIATPTVAGVMEVDVTHWLGNACTATANAGVPEVDVNYWLGGLLPTPDVTGVPEVDVTHWRSGAVPLTTFSGVPEVDVVGWQGTTVATPDVAGVPEVDVTHWKGTLTATPTFGGVPEVDVTAWSGGAVPTPAISGTPKVDITHIAGAAVSTTTAQIGVNVVQAAGTAWASGAITAASLAADAGGEIADAVWDEAVSGHTTAGTAGAMVQPIRSNTAQAGAAGTITLDASASATDDFYNNTTIQVIAGTGPAQVRRIADYVGATKVATVVPNWTTSPSSDSVFVIWPRTSVWDERIADHVTAGTTGVALADASEAALVPTAAEVADAVWDEAMSGHVTNGSFGASAQAIRSATAQAGAAGTITLDASASASDDFYNNTIIHIHTGTGVGQSRVVSDYVGSTKVATVNGNWITNPSSDSQFVIRAFGAIPGASAPTAAEVADAVWDEDATAHQTTGTFGQAIGDPAADTNTIYGAVVTGAAGATIAADVIAIQADTDNIQTRLPAALVSGRIDASVGAMAADVVTAAAVADGAIDAGAIATGAITAAKFAAGAIDAAAVATGAITAAKFAAGAIDATVIADNAIDAAALAADAGTELADALLTRDMSAVTGEAARSPLNALRLLRNKTSISGTTLTVTKEDDSTSAWTAAVTEAPGANPLSAIDPA